MSNPSPSWSDRWLGASYFLGLAPLTQHLRTGSSDLFRLHHYAQAMAAFFAGLMVLLATCLLEGADCFVAIKSPALTQGAATRFESIVWCLDYVELVVFGGMLLLWVAPLGLAIAGSTRPVPLLNRLVRRPWAIRASFLVNCLVLALVTVVLVIGVHASSLTSRSSNQAAVYFLYDEGIQVPRWGYALGLYRISLQAQRNWGAGSTVLDRLNRQTLRQALANGKVVILATHGDDGVATTYYASEVLSVWPPDTGATDETKSLRFLRMSIRGQDNKWAEGENVPVNKYLQLAYIFACNGGEEGVAVARASRASKSGHIRPPLHPLGPRGLVCDYGPGAAQPPEIEEVFP
jgi:hypothetical protein